MSSKCQSKIAKFMQNFIEIKKLLKQRKKIIKNETSGK